MYGHLGEIWISLISCNFTPFYTIDTWFSPKIIELFTDHWYKFFDIPELNFITDAKLYVIYDVA